MTESPHSNVQLTHEQMQQIDTVQIRLSNIQNEISIHNKLLTGLKSDVEAAIKEKTYQEGLATDALTKAEFAQKDLEEVNIKVATAQAIADTLQLNNTSAQDSFIEKSKELTDRESALSQSEENFAKKVEDLTTQSNQLLEDQLAVKTAKEAFLKASETIKW